MGGAALAGAGCATPTSPASGTGNTAAPVTLLLWDRNEPAYTGFFDAWQPTFAARHPNITVRFEPRPPDWHAKVAAALVAGTPPDVLLSNSHDIRSQADQQQIVPLDPFVKAARLDTQDFLQGVYKGMTWRDRQAVLPQVVVTNTVYYNRDLFSKAGVAPPKDDWTHEQFLDAAQKLTQGPESNRDVWGITSPWAVVPVRVASLLWGQCAQFNDPANRDVFTWNTAANQKAFQWLHDIPWRLRVGPATNDQRGGANDATAFFSNGSVAMLLENSNLIGTYNSSAQVNWDMAALPRGQCGQGERASLDGYVIPVGVKTPDASWTVLHELVDRDANLLRAQRGGYVPARKSQFEAWVKTVPQRNLKVAVPTDNARPDPGALWPRRAEVDAVLNPIWAALFTRNEISVSDALRTANEAMVGLFGPGGAK